MSEAKHFKKASRHNSRTRPTSHVERWERYIEDPTNPDPALRRVVRVGAIVNEYPNIYRVTVDPLTFEIDELEVSIPNPGPSVQVNTRRLRTAALNELARAEFPKPLPVWPTPDVEVVANLLKRGWERQQLQIIFGGACIRTIDDWVANARELGLAHTSSHCSRDYPKAPKPRGPRPARNR